MSSPITTLEVHETLPQAAEPAAPGNPNIHLNLLLDGKLRTQQLKFLNLQRVKGLAYRRALIRASAQEGAHVSMPEVMGRSIRVRELAYMFEEPTHCKWCSDELSAESLALTFDESIRHGGSPNIENVVAICKHCFFLKGIYPKWFWEALMDWLMQDRALLETFRKYTATWSQKAAYQRRGPRRRKRQ